MTSGALLDGQPDDAAGGAKKRPLRSRSQALPPVYGSDLCCGRRRRF